MNFFKSKKSKEYSKLSNLQEDNNSEKLDKEDIKIILDNKNDDETVIVECPHCLLKIIVSKKDANNRFFRHGVYKDTGLQIDQNMNKDKCLELVKNNKIFGCGKPYKLNHIKFNNEEIYFTEKCDYL